MRMSNNVAINMYKGFGYSVYRQVIGYYSGEEDALGSCAMQFVVWGVTLWNGLIFRARLRSVLLPAWCMCLCGDVCGVVVICSSNDASSSGRHAESTAT